MTVEPPPAENPTTRATDRVLRRGAGYAIEPLDARAEDGQWVVRYLNGKRVQITHKLADVVGVIDGGSTSQEVAQRLSLLWHHEVRQQDVDGIVDRFLLPYQLVEASDAPLPSAPPTKTLAQRWRDKLLLQDFLFRFTLIPQRTVEAVSRPLSRLLRWSVAGPALAGCGFLGFVIQREVTALATSGRLGLTDPGSYLAVLLLTFFAIVFHELGHSSAVSRFGGRPREIGFGLYFIYPALYADVNESWRFRRAQRVTVDLAGLYFQALAMATYAIGYLAAGWQPLLYAILLGAVLGLYSLVPFFKFDGYWCLSDALGVPNLRVRAFKEMSRIVRSWFQPRLRGNSLLPRWLRTTMFVYAVGSVAFFLFAVGSVVGMAPELLANYPDFTALQWRSARQLFGAGAWSEGSVVAIRWLLRSGLILGLGLMVLSLAITLFDVAKRATRGNA
jgi:putative peptide zinc metalloprotease protein